MKPIHGFAIAIIFLASCASQYPSGGEYTALSQSDNQSEPHVKVVNQAEELGQVNWGRDLDEAGAGI